MGGAIATGTVYVGSEYLLRPYVYDPLFNWLIGNTGRTPPIPPLGPRPKIEPRTDPRSGPDIKPRRPPRPQPGCLPCDPPVGTIGYRIDVVPPSEPHFPFDGTHTHIYIIQQSPDGKGCKCFWVPFTIIPGDVPPPGSIPVNGTPGGGGPL